METTNDHRRSQRITEANEDHTKMTRGSQGAPESGEVTRGFLEGTESKLLPANDERRSNVDERMRQLSAVYCSLFFKGYRNFGPFKGSQEAARFEAFWKNKKHRICAAVSSAAFRIRTADSERKSFDREALRPILSGIIVQSVRADVSLAGRGIRRPNAHRRSPGQSEGRSAFNRAISLSLERTNRKSSDRNSQKKS